MEINISPDKHQLGTRAAFAGAEAIRQAIAGRGQAHVIVATGASQFEMLDSLVKSPGIRWQDVVLFHLDDYIGMPHNHPASFHKYLRERLLAKLPTSPRAFHLLDARREEDAPAECARVGEILRRHPIDVAFVGIGENGHLAFNDPPADFATEEPFILVELDEPCRRQQFGEGWFATLDEVPRRAITMSVRQIMKARTIVCSVPDRRKAAAVKKAVTGPVTPSVPASILQEHPQATIFLDVDSASLL
jgi:glucosamine-6-phosphate deaminase